MISTEIVDVLRSGNHNCSYNLWASEKRKSDQTLNDEEKQENITETQIHRRLSEIHHQEKQLKKQKKLLYSQLMSMTAPCYYQSTFLWNSNDSGTIIIFGSWHGGLRLITPISTKYSTTTVTLVNMIDGTFVTPSVAPTATKRHPYQQLVQYQVLVTAPSISQRSKCFNCLFALLTNKDSATYEECHELIQKGLEKRNLSGFITMAKKTRCKNVRQLITKSDAARTNMELIKSNVDIKVKGKEIWSPDAIHADFETGSNKSFALIHSKPLILGCFFHFTKSIIRNIGKNGLKRQYLTNINFATNIRCLLCTAFLPVADVIKLATNQLEKLVHSVPNSKKLATKKFCNYFKRTWFNLIPPRIWNVYLRQDRTSNLLERNNKAIKAFIDPNTYFYKYVDVLSQMDAQQTQDYERVLEHGIIAFEPKRPRQRDRDIKLHGLMQHHEDNELKNPEELLLKITQVHSQNLTHQAKVLEMLEDFEEEKEKGISKDLPTHYYSQCHYLVETTCLKQMRNNIGSDRLCDVAYKYLRNDKSWIEKTKLKILNKDWSNKPICKIVNPTALLNGMVIINYNGGWYNAFIAYVEGRGVMIFTNETHKVEIIQDFMKSLIDKHVRLL